MRIRTPVMCAIAVGLLAGSSGAVTAQDADAPTTDVPARLVSPGPLGRPYADWARDYAVWRAENPQMSGCAAVEDGAVVFVTPSWNDADFVRSRRVFDPGPRDAITGPIDELRWQTDCEVTDEQLILLAIPSLTCDPIDATLGKKWEEAFYGGDQKRAEKIGRRQRNQQSNALACLLAAHDHIAQPFRVVGGQEVPIDERFLTIATPAIIDDQILLSAGYFMMLEPLTPGDHRIVWGAFKVGNDVIGERLTLNVDVAEVSAAAE
jgi:hypothetical protein